jgi:hypothetical protein
MSTQTPRDADFSGTYYSILSHSIVTVEPTADPYRWRVTYAGAIPDTIRGLDLSLRISSGLWRPEPSAADRAADAAADNPPPPDGMRWDSEQGDYVYVVCPGCHMDPCHCDTIGPIGDDY